MYLILFGKRCTVGSLFRISLYDQSHINKRKSYLDKAFGRIDEKALLVKKSDGILADGRMDLAAHCLKDLPTALSSTTQLGAIVEGKYPGDAFVLNGNNEENIKDFNNRICDWHRLRKQSCSIKARIASFGIC